MWRRECTWPKFSSENQWKLNRRNHWEPVKVKLKLCNMHYLWAWTALFWSSSKSALQGRPKAEGWTAERILWQTQLKIKNQRAGCKAMYTAKMNKRYQKYLQVVSKVLQKANCLAVERTVLEVRKVYCVWFIVLFHTLRWMKKG